MDCTSTHLSYEETGYFTNIVSAYVNGDNPLRPFYEHPVSLEGVAAAIEKRKKFPTNRKLLVEQLTLQYSHLPQSATVKKNISLLGDAHTFTVTTAHQPAIFTGNLYFIYKIVHAIKLAEHFTKNFPGNNFVPVFFMGCEDADLDELGHIHLDGEKIAWQTDQKGAIGRMKTKGLEKIIDRINGEYSILPFGKELVEILKESYLNSPDIQTATLKLVHRLFADYGLIIIIPDDVAFKRAMLPVFEDELFNHRSAGAVEKTISDFPSNFKVQAQPREINLFYLTDTVRERIERTGNEWRVVDTDLVFDEQALRKELNEHPERFSPNVILRGLMQETLLPGVAFIGGGGEIAYWLELKGVFALYNVPYPLLVIRNSFLVIDERNEERMKKLRLSVPDIFHDEHKLLKDLVKRNSEKQLSLAGEITDVTSYYDRLKTVAGQVDDTLTVHVAALQTRAIKPLQELEKKLIRAEKRKFGVQERQLRVLKSALFPNKGLQERVDNFLPYYARWGKDFIDTIYEHSLSLEQRFVVITCR